jgi:hypothetical protein
MRMTDGLPPRELNAEFDLTFQSDQIHIVVHARGGSNASSNQSNPDYENLVQAILERLKIARGTLAEVLLASKTVSNLPRSQRSLSLDSFLLPLALETVRDIRELRLSIRRAVRSAHSVSEVATHGNATKRIELVASSSWTVSEIVALLESGQVGFNPPEDAIEPESVGFLEGRLVPRTHLVRERNPSLVASAKLAFRERFGRLHCEACGFDFESTYSTLGEGFIEAHHETPLANRVEEAVTRVEDLRMVCANCHRMLHRRFGASFMTVEDLRAIITGNRMQN